jgi:hypothetical protein
MSGEDGSFCANDDGTDPVDEVLAVKPADVLGGVLVEVLAASESINEGSGAEVGATPTPHRPKTQPPTRPGKDDRLGFRETVRSF